MRRLGSTLVLLAAWMGSLDAYADDLGRVALVPEGKIQFVGELERELQASTFEVVRLEEIHDPLHHIEELVTLFAKHQVTQGILFNQGGTQAILVFLENDELRVEGQYPIHQQDRLARRRLWIWLGEILRATRKEKNQTAAAKDEPIAAPELLPVPSVAPQMSVTVPSYQPYSLGAASVLGYGSGSSFLGSYILLTASTPIHRRVQAFAHVLWPILSVGEKSSSIARSWAFQLQCGLEVFLGPLHWHLRPYAGFGMGVQLLLAELESSAGGSTSSTGSGFLASHLGTRFYISPRFALFLQVETGSTQSFTRSFDRQIASPANAWFGRVGLGLVFDR